MKPKPHIQLNNRLLPVLVGLLLLMQLILPFKGWLVLLIGLGGLWLLCYGWVYLLVYNLWLKREIRFDWAQVGDRLEERFTLFNLGPVPGLWVEVIDHSNMPGYRPGRVVGLGSMSKSRWQTQNVCTQRGIFTLGPTTLRTGDPFGLYTASLALPDSVTLPTLEVAPGGRSGEGRPRPNALERTVSAAGVRPHLPGDSLRWVHWPTTARRNALYVRLFEGTPADDWWIFLDMDRAAQVGQGYDSTTEHAIILAASLADRGLRQLGRGVGLVASGQDLVWLAPQRSDSQRRHILRELARLEPGPRSLAELLRRARPALGQVSSLIIITPAVDSAWVEALSALLRRGAVATVLLLDPASFGGQAETGGVSALLAGLNVTHHLITPDLLDQPEARPGRQGQWEWRISPSGRAIPRQDQGEVSWRELR